MISSISSLKRAQHLNSQIYSLANDRNYSITEMFSRLHRHTTHILKAVRKEKYDTIEYHLCSALSWSLALANRLHFDIAEEMWKFFPGICPYCSCAPCVCKTRRQQRINIPLNTKSRRPVSLSAWQKMFWKIYPNTVQNSAIHLAEEAGEVDEAIRNHLATHNNDWFSKIVEELVDTVTNIFAVSSCLKINLAVSFAEYFSEGCPGCKSAPCKCGYVTTDQPISKPFVLREE